MNLISIKWYVLSTSSVFVVASIIAIAVFGLRQGIDLKGGSQWSVTMTSQAVDEAVIQTALKGVIPGYDAQVKRTSDGSMLIRLPSLTVEERNAYAAALQGVGEYHEHSFSNIGPTIGAELRRKAFWAIGFVLLGISLYVAWAFRKVSKPVTSWKYGIVTLITLFHDVIIPTGLLAVLGWWRGVEVDTNFIVALLVVMGFSVHDTIVVFDRIREHLLRLRTKTLSLAEVVNQSVTETLARSVNTSFTLILVLVALLAMGPPSLFYFVLTILVGTVIGTYSSIFVASPLLYLWAGKGKN